MDRETFSSSPTRILDIYSRMLIMRMVDEYTNALYQQGYIGSVASCRGHEAAQVGSAICIEVGTDFTLPYYRDLGVLLTIGMTPYEIFRTHIQSHRKQSHTGKALKGLQEANQWGYRKHNMVAGTTPVATQILHAAGIAFAAKLRKASAVTIAYCDGDAITEPDFHEGLAFASQHSLPVIYICEHEISYSHQNAQSNISHLQSLSHSLNITYHCIDGSYVIAVNTAMQAAIQHTRAGHGPVLLEIQLCRDEENASISSQSSQYDPLLRCQRYLEEHGLWNEAWAVQLQGRINREVEQAMQDALRDA